MNGLLLVIQTISDFLWGTPMTIALIGTGLYLSIKFKFRYITKIKFHFQNTFGKDVQREKEKGKEPYLDSQQACTAMANTNRCWETSVVWQLRSRWEDQERSSGCGSQHFSECLQKPVRSFLDRDIV